MLLLLQITSSVEVLGDECFFGCTKLQSNTFERGSRLREVGRNAFLEVPVSPTFPYNEIPI
jgi:hypothetical protein